MKTRKNKNLLILILSCLIGLAFSSALQALQGPDFDGDGMADLAQYWNDGGQLSANVYLSNGSAFSEAQWVNQDGAYGDSHRYFHADFNGDGKTDMARLWDDGGSMSCDVLLSDGSSGFTSSAWAVQSGAFKYSDKWFTGDFNGDSLVDLARVYKDNGRRSIDVHLSNGSGFDAVKKWATRQGDMTSGQDWLTGDYNNDGRTDFAVIREGSNIVIDVHLSIETNFFVLETWAPDLFEKYTSMKWLSGDFDGDGYTDIAKVWSDFGDISIEVFKSDGTKFDFDSYDSFDPFEREYRWFTGDFNGDGALDIARLWDDAGQLSIVAYEYDEGLVQERTLLSKGRAYRDQDKFIVGDYNGDGTSDVAVLWGDASNWHSSVLLTDAASTSTEQPFSSLALGNYYKRSNINKAVWGDNFIDPAVITGAVPVGTDLRAVLNSGNDLFLEKGKVYDVSVTLDHGKPYQRIETHNALFITDFAELRHQLDLGEKDSVLFNTIDYAHLENVIVNGNKFEVKAFVTHDIGPALVLSTGEGFWLRRTVMYEGRSWSTYQAVPGDTHPLIEYNFVLGAGNGARGCGRPEGFNANTAGTKGWADAFSIGAANSTVRYNWLMDATDATLVLQSGKGSHLHDNLIVSYSREALGGIVMVDAFAHFDLGGGQFDYNGLIVEDNVISAPGAFNHIANPFGHIWAGAPTNNVLQGATIRNNHLNGGAFGYGFLRDGLNGIIDENNTSSAIHSGIGGNGSAAVAKMHNSAEITYGGTPPTGYVESGGPMNNMLYLFSPSAGTNDLGFHYRNYTGDEANAIVQASFMDILGRAPSGDDLAAYANYLIGNPANNNGDSLKQLLMASAEFTDKFGPVPSNDLDRLNHFRSARWRDRIYVGDADVLMNTGNFSEPQSLYPVALGDLSYEPMVGFNASVSYVSGLPASMEQGDVATVTVTMQNNGTESWSNSYGDNKRFALSALGSDPVFTTVRAYLPEGVTVASGQSYAFTFDILAPREGGVVNFEYKMMQETVGWFGAVTGSSTTVTAPAATPARQLDSVIHLVTVPTHVQPGGKFIAEAVVQNTGGDTWTSETVTLVEHSYGLGQFNTIPDGVTVAPGEFYVFEMLGFAPSSEGNHDFHCHMIDSNHGLGFGAESHNNINFSSGAAAQNFSYAQFWWDTVPAVVAPGREFEVTIVFHNGGTTTWTQAENYKLGSVSSPDNTWGETRGLLGAADSVAPNGLHMFTVRCTAPMVEGDYDFQWRMLQESVEWFGITMPNRVITVAEPSYNPYGGTARPIPGIIQFEDYDLGGEGFAYHDADTANHGGVYRTDGVDIGGTADAGGGYVVGWNYPGEWLAYTVDVTAGTYDIVLRCSSPAASTGVIVWLGAEQLAEIPIDTGGWDTYNDLTVADVNVSGGTKLLRIECIGEAFNLNHISFVGKEGPFGGTARPIPGIIQVEDYDYGGEGVAYHDADPANNGGVYRSADGVDIQTTADTGGGYQIGWTSPGEWLEYTVDVTAGAYDMVLRYSAPGGSTGVRVLLDGVQVAEFPMSATGDWDTYADAIVEGVSVSGGTKLLRIECIGGGFNLNHISFVENEPFGGTARLIPGIIQVEDYDEGGEGVAYHDADTSNDGGVYRTDGVDIQTTADTGGGHVVGWTLPGEWLEYTVDVTAGAYDMVLRYSAPGGSTGVRVLLDGVQVAEFPMSVTGDYETYADAIVEGVSVSGGTKLLRIENIGGGFNLNHISFDDAVGPYGGTARPIPGIIQVEDYDFGGEGVAYHDVDTSNDGGVYRTDGVDIQTTVDTGGGHVVGWTLPGEWLEYTVDVTAGAYDMVLRYSAPGGSTGVRVLLDGVQVAEFPMSATGDYETYADAIVTGVSVSGGTKVLRIEYIGGGFNLNHISFADVGDPYDEWKVANFSNPEGPDTGRTDDLDKDGYTNEYEYLFGMGPEDSTNSAANKKNAYVETYTHSDGKDYPSVTFSYRNDGSVSDYFIDTTTNLSTWDLDQRGANFTDVAPATDNGDNTSTVTIRYSTDFSAIPEQKLFIRVRAVE